MPLQGFARIQLMADRYFYLKIFLSQNHLLVVVVVNFWGAQVLAIAIL